LSKPDETGRNRFFGPFRIS